MRSIVGLTGPGLASRLALVLVLAPLIGLVAVVAAESVSDTLIAERLLEARSARTLGTREYSRSPLDTTTAHHSECVAFSLGLGDIPGTGRVTTALESRTYRTCPNLAAQLSTFETSGTLPAGTPYLRYWHGYSPLTRPALALFGVAGTRWIVFGLLALVMGTVYAGVRRRSGSVAAMLLVAPMLLTTDAIIGALSIMQAFGIGTAWLGGWLCYSMVRRKPTWLVGAFAGALAGAAASYLDLLTTMPGALTMSVVGATFGAGTQLAQKPNQTWRIPLAATGGWSIGMAWMWASKWLIAMVFLGSAEVIDDIKGQITFRLSGSHDGVDPSRVLGLSDNIAFWWDRPLTPLVVFVGLGVIGIWLATRWRSINGPGMLSVSLVVTIMAVPHLLWYLLLNNHSQLHVAIVYRSLPIAFGGLLAWTLAAVSDMTRARDHVT